MSDNPWDVSDDEVLGDAAPVSQSFANDMVQRIDEAFVRARSEKPRSYIGGSAINSQCDAYLALSLRGFPENDIKPTTQRIFREGHRIEDQVVADLKRAGYAIWEKDDQSGRQFAYHDWGGHVRSNIDGKIEGPEGEVMLLEIKSMNDAKFKKFKSVGVSYSHPQYLDQVQFYMGYSKLRKALFIAYNKNNSEYHAEIIEFSDEHFHGLVAKAERVLNSGTGKKCSNKSDFFQCRFCFKSDACWEGVAPDVACRTCAHSKPKQSGSWYCDKHRKTCDEPCEDYQIFAPIDKD